MSVFEAKASPALTNDHKVWELLPKFPTHLDEERIGIVFHGVSVPVSAVLIPDYDLTIEYVKWTVCRLAIDIDSLKLLKVSLHNLGPCLSVIKMDAIHTMPFCKVDNLFNQKIPRLLLSVV